jgi:SpoIID/LytB domain protein
MAVPDIHPNYHRPPPAPARIRLRIAAVAGVLSSLLFVSAVSAANAAPVLVIEGAGDGHGVGMSQDGALGYARHGASYQAILAHYYTGTTLGTAPASAVVRVLVGKKVKRVPLERYVRGVVSAEMPSQWPLAALEAQAVATRTYALTAHAGGSRFDVYSDSRSQLYVGAAAETSQTNAAVADTAGQILMYAGKPAITYFFASSGGMTENVENGFPGSEPEPWLRGVPDPYDAGPSTRFTKTMGFKTAGARLRPLVKGAFRGIEVLARGVSPRIVFAEVLGSAGDTRVDGPELAAALGLPSTWLYFGVRSGSHLRREPDLSRSAAPQSAGAGAQVGASGAGEAPAPAPAGTTARTGGVSAG